MAKEFDAALVSKVDDERTLVAVEAAEDGRHASPRGADPAEPVRSSGALDLDYVGPLVGQNRRCERPRRHRCQVQDSGAVERAGHVFLSRLRLARGGQDGRV